MSQPRSQSRADSRAVASRESNRRLIVTLVICLVVALIVVAVGIVLTRSSTDRTAETHLLASVAASRVPFLVSLSLGINWLFSPPIAVIVGVVAALVVFLATHRWLAVIHFGVLLMGTWLSSELVKVIVHRPRPQGNVADTLVPNPDPDSYPSGHVCFAVGLGFAILVLALHTRARVVVAVLAILLALVVSFSRIYLAIHFPTDILASLVFSAAAFIAIEALWRRFVAAPGPQAARASA